MQGTAHGSFGAPFKAQGRASPAPAAPSPAAFVPPLPKPMRQEDPVGGRCEKEQRLELPQRHVLLQLHSIKYSSFWRSGCSLHGELNMFIPVYTEYVFNSWPGQAVTPLQPCPPQELAEGPALAPAHFHHFHSEMSRARRRSRCLGEQFSADTWALGDSTLGEFGRKRIWVL